MEWVTNNIPTIVAIASAAIGLISAIASASSARMARVSANVSKDGNRIAAYELVKIHRRELEEKRRKLMEDDGLIGKYENQFYTVVVEGKKLDNEGIKSIKDILEKMNSSLDREESLLNKEEEIINKIEYYALDR
jgi:hypothetical protein